MTKCKSTRWGWDSTTGEVYENPGRNMRHHLKTHDDGVVEYVSKDERYLTVEAETREEALKKLSAHIPADERHPEMPH